MTHHTYDYIIVDAGSALGARESAERGRAPPRAAARGRSSQISLAPHPGRLAKLIDNPAANWLFGSKPEESTGGRRRCVAAHIQRAGRSSSPNLTQTSCGRDRFWFPVT